MLKTNDAEPHDETPDPFKELAAVPSLPLDISGKPTLAEWQSFIQATFFFADMAQFARLCTVLPAEATEAEWRKYTTLFTPKKEAHATWASRLLATHSTEGIKTALHNIQSCLRVDFAKCGLEVSGHIASRLQREAQFLQTKWEQQVFKRAMSSTGTPTAGSGQQSDAPSVAGNTPGAERSEGLADWRPPPGYVSTSDIKNDSRFTKRGKNPPFSTVQRWIERAKRESTPVKIVQAPDTSENHYPEDWVLEQVRRWDPRAKPGA